MGYRTLVMAHKKIEKAKAESFLEKLEELRTMPEKLQKLYAEFESDLTLLGCTGVEDKLQAGVPETLRMLAEAGIKILMLTGDKLETAISVASSCGLINTDDKEIVLVLEKLETQQQIEKNLEG
jgi:P-type E1-E2 ATPase